MAFVHIKRNLGFRRLRLRGIACAKKTGSILGLSFANAERLPRVTEGRDQIRRETIGQSTIFAIASEKE
jgi:hypothetical protein